MYDTQTYVLTIEEVAARLDVTDRTIRSRMKKRGVPSAIAKRIGRRWRFSEAVFNSDLALAG